MMRMSLAFGLVGSILIHLGVLYLYSNCKRTGLQLEEQPSSIAVYLVEPSVVIAPVTETSNIEFEKESSIEQKVLQMEDSEWVDVPIVVEEESTEIESSVQEDFMIPVLEGGQQEAQPLIHQNKRPQYPALAVRKGYEGVVYLQAKVSKEGDVVLIRTVTSSGYDVLDKAAISAAQDWRFLPAMMWGHPVESWVDVSPIRFQLETDR